LNLDLTKAIYEHVSRTFPAPKKIAPMLYRRCPSNSLEIMSLHGRIKCLRIAAL